MKRPINAALLIGLIGIFTIGSSLSVSLYRVFWGDDDIYWTPQSMSLPYKESSDYFQIYIGDELFSNYLAKGYLTGLDDEGNQFKIVEDDISFRLNNWNKTQAVILKTSVLTAFLFGISVSCFIIGILKVFKNKD